MLQIEIAEQDVLILETPNGAFLPPLSSKQLLSSYLEFRVYKVSEMVRKGLEGEKVANKKLLLLGLCSKSLEGDVWQKNSQGTALIEGGENSKNLKQGRASSSKPYLSALSSPDNNPEPVGQKVKVSPAYLSLTIALMSGFTCLILSMYASRRSTHFNCEG